MLEPDETTGTNAEEIPASEESAPEESAPESAAAEQPAAEPDPVPAAAAEPPARPRRRRAASRPAGPPRVLDPVVPPAELAPAPDRPLLESPADAAASAPEPVTPPEGSATPQGDATAEVAAPRRRGTRRAGPPARDAGDDASGDVSVAAQLEQLSEQRRLQDEVANPFRPADVTAALDDLAAAIGGLAAAESSAQDATEQAEEDSADEESPAEATGTPQDEDAQDEDAQDRGDSDEGAPDEGGSDEEESDDDDADGEGADNESAPRRRRRRRGGRRRRRGGEPAEASDGDDGEETDAEDTDDGESEEGETSETEESAEVATSGRRRRRRRRRGEETDVAEEEGVDVVVKVREPRSAKTAVSEVTGIEGSTRMEAKKQRRREGRAAGRRRAPILSEAEFLARRESVERQMLIRQAEDYTQIAVLEDGILVEHYVDRDSSASLIGNIYLGRVQNVLPSMEAAFVDIGRGRNAVLYAGEVDWDSYGVTGDDRRVEKVLKSGQPVLVQVTKDPIGAKGARLTAHISIPGRYVVYCPGGQLSGISRKLPENERARLKGILDEAVGESASVIVRTAASGASEEELLRDVNRLKAQWEVIEKKVKAGQAPQQLYTEPDLTVRIVRDLFTEDFSSLVVDGNGEGEDAFDTVQAYVTHVAPILQPRLRHWDRESEGDVFEKFRVHEQVAKALERKVHLPSGGSLIIDRTEAMTVIDVNTGKFTGTQGNLEATVTANNLEAAEEIVRQLRLRDIGGIIIIDFIDMVLPANRELLLRRLVECLGRDRTRHQVAEVTSLGLVQMTRKRIGTGLAEAFTVNCEACKGRGYHIHDAPVASQAPADGGDRDGGRRAPGKRGGRGKPRGSEAAGQADASAGQESTGPEPGSDA